MKPIFQILFSLFFIFFCSINIFSQSIARLDSLNILLAEQQQPNEERLDLLIQIIPWLNDSLDVVEKGNEVLTIAQQLKKTNKEVKALRRIAAQYTVLLNDLPTALKYINKAIALSDQIDDLEKVKNYTDRARIYSQKLRQPKKGLEDGMKANEYNKKLPDKEKYGWLYIYLGELTWMDGDLEKSKEHFLEALRIDQIQEKNISSAYICLGNVDYALGNYSGALEYFFKALEIIENSDLRNIEVVLQNISSIYISKGDFEKALEIVKKELKYALDSDLPQRICQSNLNVGIVQANLSNNIEALNSLNTALRIAKENKFGIKEYVIYLELASIYTKGEPQPDSILYYINAHEKTRTQQNVEGNSYKKNYCLGIAYTEKGNLVKGEQYLKEALDIASQRNDIFSKSDCHNALYSFYEKKNNPAQALYHFKEFNILKDTMRSNTQNMQIADMQTKYDTEKKETENKGLLVQNNFISKQNQQYKIGAGILTGLLALLGYFFFQLRKTRNLLTSQNQQLEQLNTTKDKFFGIIAHDIRSPIVALDGVGEQMDFYLKKNKTDKLQRLAGRVDSTAKRLSSLLDNLLNWALLQQGVIPYHPKALSVKEVGEDIFQMFQSNADTKNITLHLQISDNQKVHADESALNTILRNLISNAIKFTPEGGTVSLSTETKGDKVFININDTGTGISAEKLSKLFSLEKKSEKGTAGEKGTGLGLTLVKELADLNKGSIDVNSVLEKGTTFKLGLPIAA